MTERIFPSVHIHCISATSNVLSDLSILLSPSLSLSSSPSIDDFPIDLQDDTDRICFSCKNYHSSYWSIYTLDKSADKINTLGDPGWGASGASGWNTEHILIVAGGGGGA